MTKSIDELLKLVVTLRDPENGCPFDVKETFDSHAKYTLKEVAELVDAIDRQDWQNVKEELGDLLFHVIFYAQMAQEKNLFNFDEIVRHVVDKMHRRHPHVFGEEKTQSIEEVQGLWQRIKTEENKSKPPPLPGPQNYNFGAKSLPTLMRMQEIAKKSKMDNMFWPDTAAIIDHMHEELHEIETATSPDHREEELGDALVAMVSLAQAHNVNAERALQKAISKFMQRWQAVYELAAADGKELKNLTRDEMQPYWKKVK